MAALTWRNVDSPDFTPAMRGFEQFSQLLDRSFTRAGDALKTFDDAETERTSNEFIQNILSQYAGSPDQLNADLQSGRIFEGVNRERLDSRALDLLARRPTELLNYATGAQRLADATADTAFEGVERGWKTEDRSFETADRDAIRAARPLAQALINAPDENAARAIWSDPTNQAIIAALPTEQQVALRTSPLSILSSELGLTTTRKTQRAMDDQHASSVFQLGRDQWQFGVDQESYEDQQAGMAFADAVLASAQTPEDALVNMENSAEWQRMSPGARNVARAQVSGQFGNLYMPPAGSGGGGNLPAATNADPTRIMNYEARDVGIPTVPPNIRTLGQASEFARQVNRSGASSSAMGMYQITGQTLREFGPRALGSNWQNAEFNAQNQDRVAEAIFNASNHSAAALRGRWVSLSPAEAERIRRLPWEQAREVIARRESSSSPAAVLRVDTAVTTAQRNNGRGQNRWASNLNNESTAAEVAIAMRNTPQFNNVPATWISEQITSIVNRSRVNGVATLNENQAGQILARTTSRGARSAIRRIIGLDFNDTNLGSGFSTDNDAITAAINDARRGGPQDRQVANEAAASGQATVDSAQASYNAAVAALNQMYASGRQSVIAANRDRLTARVEAARRQLVMAQRAQADSGAAAPARAAPDEGFSLSDLFRIRRE